MPISRTIRRELHRRWRGPPSPYREALNRVQEELENHAMAINYVVPEQVSNRISGRIKTIPRIIEKVDRDHPRNAETIDQLEAIVTDIAGTRITVDYLYQAIQIRTWVVNHNAWIVQRVEETVRDNGYRAIHINLKVDTTHFVGVPCEIQIRTLLQDAWAIWAHPLYIKYRRDLSKIPKKKRELMRQLSDMLHAADEMVQTLM